MASIPNAHESTMTHLSLPADVWDEILNHLWDDTSALRACALTCRHLLPTTRRRLFHDFKLHKELGPDMMSVLESGSASSIGSMAVYVRRMTFDVPSPEEPQEDVARGGAARRPFGGRSVARRRRPVPSKPSWRPQEGLQILTYFTQVTDLTLRHMSGRGLLNDSDSESPGHRLGTLVNVKYLQIDTWTPSSPDDVVALVHAFPLLSKLRLYRVKLPADTSTLIPSDAGHSTTGSSSRRLEDVVLMFESIRGPAAPAGGHPNIFLLLGPPYLSDYAHRLELRLTTRSDQGAINDTLHVAAASLRHLHLSISEPTILDPPIEYMASPFAVVEPNMPNLMLVHNTKLETLTIEVATLARLTPMVGLGVGPAWLAPRLPATSVWIVALLSVTNSEYLQRVEIIMPDFWDHIWQYGLAESRATIYDDRPAVDVLNWTQIRSALLMLFKRHPTVHVRFLIIQPSPEKRDRAETAFQCLAETLSLGSKAEHRVEVLWK